MPAAAGAAIAEVTPGTTSCGTPAARSASHSSAPRPNTKGSPPFSLTTARPARAAATKSALISCWATAWPAVPGRFPTKTRVAQDGASARRSGCTNRSYTTTSAERRSSIPRRRHGDGGVRLAVDRRRDEAAVGWIVHGVEQDTARLCFGPHGAVHSAIVGRRDREERACQIAGSIRPPRERDAPRDRKLREAARHRRADDRHPRARVDQASDLLLRDGAAADDHRLAPPQVEKRGIEVGHVAASPTASRRNPSSPTRLQKSPRPSSGDRSARKRSSNGRTAATSR